MNRPTDFGERFLRRRAHQGGVAERKKMIDRTHKPSITRQAKLLPISHGSVYYKAKPVSPEIQALMNCIDRLHLDYRFAGGRMLRDLFCREGHEIGRERVSSFMKVMHYLASQRRHGDIQDTRFIRTCFESWRLLELIRPGRWLSPTSPWPEALCTWPQ